jgi:hypothetical protein
MGSLENGIQKLVKKGDIANILEIMNKSIDKHKSESAFECAIALGELRKPESVAGIVEMIDHYLSDITTLRKADAVTEVLKYLNIIKLEPKEISVIVDFINSKPYQMGKVVFPYQLSVFGIIIEKLCVSATLAWALGEIGDKQAAPTLIKIITPGVNNHRNIVCKIESIKALAKLGDTRTEEILLKILNDNWVNDLIKAHAAKGLGVIGSQNAVETLFKQLSIPPRDPDLDANESDPFCLGCYAAEAIGNIGNTNTLSRLKEYPRLFHKKAIISAIDKIEHKPGGSNLAKG